MPYPHEGTLARLGISDIHGIGAFAIRDIAAGTKLFAADQREVVWVDAGVVDALQPGSPERRFYVDFGIRRGERIGCPASFDLLTVGWYVNEPRAGETPNLVVDDSDEMFAARDIAAGEELTVTYASFSEPAPESSHQSGSPT